MLGTNKRNSFDIIIALLILAFLLFIGVQSYILMPLVLFGAIIISYIVYVGQIYLILIPFTFSIIIISTITKNLFLGVALTLSYILAGIVLSIMLKKKKELKFLLSSTILSYIFPIIIFVFLTDKIKKISVLDKYYFNAVENIFNNFKRDLIKEMDKGFEFPFSPSDIELQIQNFVHTLKILFPGMLIVLLATISIIVIYSVVNLLRRKGFEFKDIPKFIYLRAPKTLIIILLVVYFGSGKNTIYSEAMLNMSYVLYSFLIFFGISLTEFYFRKSGINLPFRIIIYILIYFAFIPLQLFIPLLDPLRILIVLAIIDSFFNFRSRNKEEN